MDPRQRLDSRKLRREIEEYLEASRLDYGSDHQRLTKHQGHHALYAKSTLIGYFPSPYVAEFVQRAPTWLRQLLSEVRRLEADAYETRAQRRRLSGVERELRDVGRLGPQTKEGQEAVRRAIEAMRDGQERESDRRGF